MQTDDTLKSDEKDLDAGCVLFRAIFRAAITRGDSAGQTAVTVVKQFIDLAGPANPNLDQWTLQVLQELTKDPQPMGMYATAVAEAVCQIIRSDFEYVQ